MSLYKIIEAKHVTIWLTLLKGKATKWSWTQIKRVACVCWRQHWWHMQAFHKIPWQLDMPSAPGTKVLRTEQLILLQHCSPTDVGWKDIHQMQEMMSVRIEAFEKVFQQQRLTPTLMEELGTAGSTMTREAWYQCREEGHFKRECLVNSNWPVLREGGSWSKQHWTLQVTKVYVMSMW